VKSFIVDAGTINVPAFTANNVSPRVSETIIPPHIPLRTRAFKNVPMSAASARAVAGAVCRNGGSGGFRAVGRRVVLDRVDVRAAGRRVPAAGVLGFAPDEAGPFWAAAACVGTATHSAANHAVARRLAPVRIRF
jgi:hypothetical protein